MVNLKDLLNGQQSIPGDVGALSAAQQLGYNASRATLRSLMNPFETGYAQMGNKRVTLADIGGANDPFAKNSTGRMNVVSFGDAPTASLNPDIQRAYADTWQKEQQQQVQRGGMPQGLTLDEFVQKYGPGRDKGALMQLYHQMEDPAVRQGYLARAAQPDQSTNVTQTDPRMALEQMRQDRMDARQVNSLAALAERWRDQTNAKAQQSEDKRSNLITRQMMTYKKRMDDLWGLAQNDPVKMDRYNSYRRGLQDLINESERAGVDWDNASVGLRLQSNKPAPKPTAKTTSLDMNNSKVQAAIKAGYTPEEISEYLASRR